MDHPVTRRDESDSAAVELAALLAVDLLRWFSDFVAENARTLCTSNGGARSGKSGVEGGAGKWLLATT